MTQDGSNPILKNTLPQGRRRLPRLLNLLLREVSAGGGLHARGVARQEGQALVETAVSLAVFLLVLFGLIAFGYALYAYNFVSDAARVATRYAIVRDSNSCTIAPAFPDCDLHKSAPLQTLVQNLGYPGLNANNLTLTATWLSRQGTTAATWGPCNGTCNNPGDAVNVVVTYTLPLNIPFWQNGSLTVSSTSQMVIN